MYGACAKANAQPGKSAYHTKAILKVRKEKATAEYRIIGKFENINTQGVKRAFGMARLRGL